MIGARAPGAGLALAALLAAGQVAAQPVPRTAPVAGRVSAVNGGEEVTLVPERQWRRVIASQDLKAGDVLRTNASGTLAIVFADRTQIRLGRNSVLVVKAVSAAAPSALELQRGRLWGRSPRAQQPDGRDPLGDGGDPGHRMGAGGHS